MALNLSAATHSFIFNAGYPAMLTINYEDGSSQLLALSADGVWPESDNWIISADGYYIFSDDGVLVRTDGEEAEFGHVTAMNGSTKLAGVQPAISSLSYQALGNQLHQTLDMTAFVNSLIDVEGSSGLETSLIGFANDAEAFASIGDNLMRVLEDRKFELIYDGDLKVFEGYANREKLGFKPDIPEGLPMKNDMIDWSDSRWDRVEIISGVDSKISTSEIPHSINNEWLRMRLGDLKLDNNSTLELTFVAYIKGVELGFVLTANHQIPLAKAAVFRKRFNSQ